MLVMVEGFVGAGFMDSGWDWEEVRLPGPLSPRAAVAWLRAYYASTEVERFRFREKIYETWPTDRA